MRTFRYDPGSYASLALVRAGFIPTSPLVPSIAYDIRLIDLYRSINKFHRRLGLQPFVRAMHDYHDQVYLTASAHAFSKAFDIYLSINRSISSRLDAALGRSHADYRMQRSCAACTYTVEGEPQLPHSILLAADGNMSLRRFEKVGTADTSIFDSDYFISRDSIEAFANVAQSRPGKKNKDPATLEEENIVDAEVEGAGKEAGVELSAEGGLRPLEADPLGDTFSGLVVECVERWKANADDDKKVMWDVFDECGIFITICRHGILLLACDIIKSGEQYIYLYLKHTNANF